MWLVAETPRGLFLEYWQDQKCVVSFKTDATIDELEKLKALLAACKVTQPKLWS